VDDPKPSGAALFVHSAVDDAGLSPQEARVLMHIARRGDCYSGVKEMARVCRMNKQTVFGCLRRLTARSLIVKETRRGKPHLYRVAPISAWVDRKEGLTESRGQPADRDATRPKAGVRGLTESRGHKGNPLEGDPMKGETAPRFEPLSPKLYRRELEAMLVGAKAQVKQIKADRVSYAKDLTKAAEEVIEFLEREKRDGWEEKVQEIKAKPTSYERTTLKPKAALIVQAWTDRIADIKRAMDGIVN
jgi:hypothetical protein